MNFKLTLPKFFFLVGLFFLCFSMYSMYVWSQGHIDMIQTEDFKEAERLCDLDNYTGCNTIMSMSLISLMILGMHGFMISWSILIMIFSCMMGKIMELEEKIKKNEK